MVKKYILIAVLMLLTLVFWVSIKGWVEGEVKFADWQVWWWPLMCLILLSSMTVLTFMLIREWRWRLLVSLMVGLTFLLVFKFAALYLAMIVLVVIIFMHWLAARNIDQELDERTHINAARILHHGLPWIITPLLITTSFAFYLDPKIQASASASQLPPTVRETIVKTVEIFLGGELSQMPSAQREQTKYQLISETERMLTSLARPYMRFTPPLIAFGLYLILQGLSWFFIWPATWLGQILFWGLKRLNLVKISERQIPAETIVF